MSTNKPKQVRLYLADEKARQVEQLASNLGQAESWIMTTLCSAALEAVLENGGRMSLPLQLQVAGAEIHEGRAAPPKRKTG